jgi:hypothetical protein
MGNETRVSTVAFGGSLAVIFLIFFGPAIAEYRGGPLPEGAEGAFTVFFIVLLTWFLPARLRRKLDRKEKLKLPEAK